jgi:hypothetical protein
MIFVAWVLVLLQRRNVWMWRKPSRSHLGIRWPKHQGERAILTRRSLVESIFCLDICASNSAHAPRYVSGGEST